VASNRILGELHARPQYFSSNVEIDGRLNPLEDFMQAVLHQTRPRAAPAVESRPASFHLSASDSGDLDSLRRRWDELNESRQGQPAQPTPVRSGPNLNDTVAEMLASGPTTMPASFSPPTLYQPYSGAHIPYGQAHIPHTYS
jgi:hypothetical protein